MNSQRNGRELENERAQNERATKGPDTLHKAKIRLYDRIKGKVSVGTMDKIIVVTVALIVAAIVVGMIIGG